MTVEELEIIIRANIGDAIKGIKTVASEVKKAVSDSIQPMKQITNETKNIATTTASSVNSAKKQLNNYVEGVKSTAKQQELLKTKINELKDVLNKADKGVEVGDVLKVEADLEKLQNKLYDLENKEHKIRLKVIEENNEKNSSRLGLKDIGSRFGGAIKQTGKFLGGQSIKGMLAPLKSGGFLVDGLKNKIKSFGSSTNKALNKGIKLAKTFAIRLIGIRTAMAGVSKAASAYLSFDSELQNSFSNSWNKLGALLAPALELVANLFVKATSAAVYFVKALTGIDLVAKANAKALKSQSNAQKSLSSLDEIENINQNNDSGGDLGLITNDAVNNLSYLDKIIKDLKDGNYYEIGKTIATNINKSLANINWDSIKSKSEEVGRNIAQFLNGGIDNLDWSLFGKTLAEGINTGINFAYGFIDTFHFKEFGKGLGEEFFSFWDNIDWSRLGKTLSDGIKGALDIAIEFLRNVDWEKVGEDVGTFLTSIDWVGIGIKIIQLICEGASAIYSFFAGMGGKIWDELKKTDWIQVGKDIINGIIEGIQSFAKGFGKYFQFIIDVFKDLFGIHSPSTLFSDFGKNLIQGLINGIGNIWNNVKSKFNSFKSSVSSFFTSSNFSSLGKNVINGITSGIANKYNDLKRSLSNVASFTTSWLKAKLNIHSPSRVMKDEVGENITAGVAEGIDDNRTSLLSSLKNVLSDVRDNFQNLPTLASVETSNGLNDLSSTISNSRNQDYGSGIDSVINNAILNAFSQILPYLQNSNNVGEATFQVGETEFAKLVYELYNRENSRRNVTDTKIVRRGI